MTDWHEIWRDLLPVYKWVDGPLAYRRMRNRNELEPIKVHLEEEPPGDFQLAMLGWQSLDGVHYSYLLQGSSEGRPNGIQFTRICRVSQHPHVGWHGIQLPSGPEPVHEDDPVLTGTPACAALKVFCRRTNLDIVENQPGLFPLEEL